MPCFAAPLLDEAVGTQMCCRAGWHSWQLLPAQVRSQSWPVRLAELINRCVFLTGPFSGCLVCDFLNSNPAGQIFAFCPRSGSVSWGLCSSHRIPECTKPSQEHSWNCSLGLCWAGSVWRCFPKDGLLRPIHDGWEEPLKCHLQENESHTCGPETGNGLSPSLAKCFVVTSASKQGHCCVLDKGG